MLVYTYTFGVDGQPHLSAIGDRFGRQVSIHYDGRGRAWMIKAPDNATYTLSYNGFGALVGVTFPDGTTRQYLYNDARFPFALTGIVDGSGAMYAHFGYDANGLANLTEHAGGAERISVSYLDATQVQVVTQTNAVSFTTKTFTQQYIAGAPRITQIAWQPCAGCAPVTENYRYDSNGYLAQKTDVQGVLTQYSYDLRGNPLARIEAAGTPYAHAVSAEWHPLYQLPTEINDGPLRSQFIYDSSGNVLSHVRTDKSTGETRTTRFAYNSLGLLIQVDGPRDDAPDISGFSYDVQGNLTQATNALSQSTAILARDGNSRPTQIRDANGVVTQRAYDANGRITGSLQADSQWKYQYDGAGRMARITNPTNGVTELSYDNAGRLIGLHDKVSGGQITYALNAQGNPLRTEARDPSGMLLRLKQQIHDDLGRLSQILDAEGNASVLSYDGNNRLTSVTDPIGNASYTSYDPLGRAASVRDALGAITNLSHDGNGRVTSVTDARSLSTKYRYNAFGELIQQDSPDTGRTTSAYDKAGNLVRRQDARGVITFNTYDALNRLTSTRYQGSTATDTLQTAGVDLDSLTYSYDGSNDPGTPNGIGRLTGISGNQNQITYRYDARGNLSSDIRVIGNTTQKTSYTYDAANSVSSISYPGGRVVQYQRDAAGRIIQISTLAPGGVETLVASNIQYEPFPGGKLLSYVGGDSRLLVPSLALNTNLTLSTPNPQRIYDLNGRLIRQTDNVGTYGLKRTYNYDARGWLRGIQDSSAAIYIKMTAQGGGIQAATNRDPRNYVYQYDAIGRLTQADGHWGQVRYGYDVVGNRTSQQFNPSTASLASTNTASPTSPANPPIPTSTAYSYANDSQRLLSAIATGDAASNRTYAYSATGQPTTAGNLMLAYDNSDRGLIAANLTPSNAATLIQHFAPEGWRDQKLGNGNLARFAYDHEGHLLEETNVAATAAMQQADPFVTQSLNTFNQNVVRALPGALSPVVQSLPLLTQSQKDLVNGLTASGIATTAPVSETTQADLRYKLYPARREIIWLDDLPIATIQARKQGAPPEFFFIHSDHLNQPQRINDTAGLVAWERSQLPFGEDWQDPQPAAEISQTGVITTAAYVSNQALLTGTAISFNLRFPGQFSDPETQLHQNWMRDYDPTLGRYIQSDPIGLMGGINTYAYVEGNPISYIDPVGLLKLSEDLSKLPIPPGLPAVPYNPAQALIECISNPAKCKASPDLLPSPCIIACNSIYQNDLERCEKINDRRMRGCDSGNSYGGDGKLGDNNSGLCKLEMAGAYANDQRVIRNRRDKCLKNCR